MSPKHALNALKFEAHDLTFDWEGGQYHFEFVPSKAAYEPVVWLKGTIGAASFDIGLREWPKLYFANKELLQVDLKALPQAVAKSIIEGAFLEIVESLENVFRQEITLKSIEFGAAQAPYAERLEFAVIESNHRSTIIDGALFIPETLLPLFAEAWQELPLKAPEKTNLLVEGLALLEIGRQTLTLGEYRSLRVNDIVLLGEGPHFQEGEVWVSFSEDQVFQANWQRGKLTLESPLLFQTLSLNSSMDIERIPLDLQFVVGQKKLTLQELRALKPGYSFDFPASLEGPVKLMVNNQLVGTGEVVMLEDRLGVRLIGLGHIADAHAKSSAKKLGVTPPQNTPAPFEEENSEDDEEDEHHWEDDDHDENEDSDEEEEDDYGADEDSEDEDDD